MASGLSEFEFKDSFFKKVDEREIEESQGEEEEEDAEEERDEELLELIEGEDELQNAKAYLSKNKMLMSFFLAFTLFLIIQVSKLIK